MNRRRFKRYDFSFEILCKKVSSLFWTREVYTGNISRGGLKIYIKRNLPKGTLLRLKILNPFIEKPIMARARVVWSEKKFSDNNVWTIGLDFINMRWTDSGKLLYGVGE